MTKISRAATAHIPSKFGDFDMMVYVDATEPTKEHIAFVHREIDINRPVPVRVHSECITGDLFGSSRCDCGEQLDAALQYVNDHPGIILYLRQEGRGIGLINKLKAYNLQDQGLNTIDANLHLGLAADAREYDVAVGILRDLGIQKIRLLTNNPEKIKALEDCEIEVVDRIPIVIKPNDQNKGYLHTKRDLMGHLF